MLWWHSIQDNLRCCGCFSSHTCLRRREEEEAKCADTKDELQNGKNTVFINSTLSISLYQ